MRIANLKIYRIASAGLNPVLVELVTDEGGSGFGEAGVAYGYGAGAVCGMLQDLAPHLLGRNPGPIRAIWQDLYDHSFWAKGGGAIVFAAMSAIELALWDLKGRALGVPVQDLLGGPLLDSVRVYANGWNHQYDDVVQWARAASRPLADGYTSLKCYPFAHELADGTLRHASRRMLDPDHFRRAVARMRALRAEVGPQVELMADLSGGLVQDQLLRFLDVCGELDLAWIEEPLDPFDFQGLKGIPAHSGIPVAVGERLYTRGGFRRALDTGAVAVVMPDVANCGGLFEAVQIAGLAETCNARVAPHNCASSLCTAASLTLCACVANTMMLEVYPYFADARDFVQVLENPPERAIRNGTLAISPLPGLGAVIDRKAIGPFLAFDHRRDRA